MGGASVTDTIYEVLDAQAAGVRLQIEVQRRFTASLAASGIPFIRAVVLHNESGRELSSIRLTAELAVAGRPLTRWEHEVPGPLAPNGATRLDDPRLFDVLLPTLTSAVEATPAALGIESVITGAHGSPTPGPSVLAALDIRAVNEFLNYPGLHAALASFVQPNARQVTPILRSASELLLATTKNSAIDGYQSGAQRAQQIAGAIYEALRAARITYVNPPASFESTGQKVRTTEQVLQERFGTCIDLAVLYAACLEAAGLMPLIFLTSTHAFGGFYASELYGEAATIQVKNTIANLVEIGQAQAVELTGVGPGVGSRDFRSALRAGSDQVRSRFDELRSMLDVTRARLDGVRPMAAFGSGAADADEPADLDAERPFVARSTLRGLTEAADEEIVRGVLDRRDDSPARFRAWKRDLLDLSLRNPLLNMPRSTKVMDLVVPPGMLPALDDVVHSGKTVRLLGGVDSTDLMKLAGEKTASEIAPDVMRTLFGTTRSVFSSKDDQHHRAQLRTMKREADTLEQETGSNYLFLALGSLVHEKPSGGEARAPLFLLPVRITGGLALAPYAFKLDGEDVAQPNLCLLEWLTTTQGLELPELATPAIDDSGIAIGAVLAGIRKRLVEAGLPFRIDETASLAILRFSTFQIWKDLDENWRTLVANPVVEHLVERPGETFADPAGADLPPLDEQNLRLPIAADGTQMAAVVRAVRGQSFVLEGPPGTGKSQTITNLIAHALGEGKKVLFVAEKQAALEVVKRRLDAIGLGSFCLELHGAKQSMKYIRDQLRTALELRPAGDDALWAMTDSRLRTTVAALDRYPPLLHGKNLAGYSLWSSYDAKAALGEGPTAVVPSSWVAAETADAASDLTRGFADAASRIGLAPGHPWLLVGARDAAALDLERIQSGLAELTAVQRRLAELSPDWTAALAQTPPGQALRRILTLLDARAAGGVPERGELVAIDRPSWREVVSDLRRRLAEFRASHRATIASAAPALVEAADLTELLAHSAELDGVFLFRETRRAKTLERASSLLAAGASVGGPQLTELLGRVVALRDASLPLASEARSITGLHLPVDWQPYGEGAIERFDAAVNISTAAVAIAGSAPLAWAALPATTADDDTALRDIAQGWDRWISALHGDDGAVRSWIGSGQAARSWPTAWTTDATTWQRDLESTQLLQLDRIAELRRLLSDLAEAGLPDFAEQLARVDILPGDASEALLRGIAAASLTERIAGSGLDRFDPIAQDRVTAGYLDAAALSRDLLQRVGPATLLAQRPFQADNLRGEVAELARQIERKRGGLSFREITSRYPDALQSITPCFLMSPGSVAHYLDPATLGFDLVVFDEASQIRVSQAIGAMGRGRSVVVVGDSRQMPPTRVMQVEAAPGTDSAEEIVIEDLESILTESVESGLPQLWLGWHYRSRDESLIAFSNSHYYDDRLVSLPSPGVDPQAGVTWRRVNGRFDRGRTRTNELEARAILDEIADRLRDPATAKESIGVVCFNIQQRDLILNLLEDSQDLLIQKALTAEPGLNLFVKNLENVQGDERDTILFSLAFSIDPATKLLPLNFGPLNLDGGERRLNVAITRARKQIVLVSSFDPADIDLRRSSARGIADLKAYLQFAAERPGVATPAVDERRHGRFVEEIATALRAEGYEAEVGLGMSAFTVDIAARRAGETTWRLAVMVDGPAWSSRPTVADREGSPLLLRDIMGWRNVQRVWLPGWIRDPEGTLDALVTVLETPDPVAPPKRMPSAFAAPTAAVVEEPAAQVRLRSAPGTAPVRAISGPGSAAPATLRTVGANARPAIALSVFTPAPDAAIASPSVLENMRMAAPAAIRIAAEILDIEGPIPLTRLVGIVARRFGVARLTEGRRDDLTKVLGAGFRIVDDFAWPAGVDPKTWRGARTAASTEDRPLSDVSLEEIINAMELVLRESFSMTRDELIRAAADVLGYSRISDQARTRMTKAMTRGSLADRFRDDGKRVRLE